MTNLKTAFSARLKWLLPLFIGLIYYFTNPKPNAHYDYTWRIAQAILEGRLGLTEHPGAWLNELVPYHGIYYSVFPLGSVLSMMPLALLAKLGWLGQFPAAFLSAILSAAATAFFFAIAKRHNDTLERRIVLSLFPSLATWMWPNLAFAGAWHIALGFSVVGQAGAIYYTLVKPRPWLAGFFFALGFGNRTDVLLTFPILLFFLLRSREQAHQAFLSARPEDRLLRVEGEERHRVLADSDRPRKKTHKHNKTKSQPIDLQAVSATPSHPTLRTLFLSTLRREWRDVWALLAIPLALGILTLAYNNARFGSITDFGYARIPGVLEEYCYRNGIFSLAYIPHNMQEMLFRGWKSVEAYPYLVPTGWGGSILLACPLLLLLFRRGARDKGVVLGSWLAISLTTFVLWVHGNAGGWQYSYRYAMVLLPWIFLILLERPPLKFARIETGLFAISVLINAWAAYLFLWTPYMSP